MKKKKSFFHSYGAVCGALVLICIGLMLFNLYIMKETRIYVFGGYSDGITVMDGTIFTSIKTNRFSAPLISYTNEDIILKEFKIGYYIEDHEISVISNENSDLEEVSLMELLHNSEYSFTETHKDALHFNRENLKNIDI